jgi:hypothetical protein
VLEGAGIGRQWRTRVAGRGYMSRGMSNRLCPLVAKQQQNISKCQGIQTHPK